MAVVAIFILGYFAIALEHLLKPNKSAAALLTGVLCWTAHILTRRDGDYHAVNEELAHHIGGLAQILFFLLTAMTIVELVDAHEGFELITTRITTANRRALLISIAVLTFVLSAVLDNLTTSIVMVSLVRKLVADAEDRASYGAAVIIAANAGGVWSPIGDVTTTMLWVGQQISTGSVVTRLLIPAVVSAAVPLLWLGLRMKGDVRRASSSSSATSSDSGLIENANEEQQPAFPAHHYSRFTLPTDAAVIGRSLSSANLRARTGASVAAIVRDSTEGEQKIESALLATEQLRPGDRLTLTGSRAAIGHAVDLLLRGNAPSLTTPLERRLVLAVGAGVLLFIPVFKWLTHLPPMMGILLGLGILWLVTEMIHRRRRRNSAPKKKDEKNEDDVGDEDLRRSTLSVAGALQRIDAQSVLFFLGILLAIAALESEGTLRVLASWLDQHVGNIHLITVIIGLVSSIVDNVPLVAAAQGMYPLSTYPRDHEFWLFLAYCAGTGGSILIIGSAAGIAVMGIERITFGAYFRKMSLPATLGYGAGAAAYLLQSMFW